MAIPPDENAPDKKLPDKNASFYREVDEELRREQIGDFWTRYGRILLIAAIVIVAAAAAYVFWQKRETEAAGRESETLDEAIGALGKGDEKGAAPKLDTLAASKNEGYRASALLTKADLLLGSGKDKEAAAAFGRIFGDTAIPEAYRELALVRQTAAEYDSIAPALVIERLGSFAKPGNPWFGSAGEMVAVAYLKQQKPERAARIFAGIAGDEGVPESIRARATQMAGTLGLDAIEDSPETASAPAKAKE